MAMAADPSAIPITSSKATVAIAPNNTATTVVNIQAPTAAGLSHNQYSKFNVTKGGRVHIQSGPECDLELGDKVGRLRDVLRTTNEYE